MGPNFRVDTVNWHTGSSSNGLKKSGHKWVDIYPYYYRGWIIPNLLDIYKVHVNFSYDNPPYKIFTINPVQQIITRLEDIGMTKDG